MRGLTVIVAGQDPARLRSALGIAATQAALGGPARLFLDGVAAGLLCAPITAPDDAGHIAAGLPSLSELVDTSLALGARIILCQTGLALAGIAAASLDPRLETGGMTGLLAALGDDRLIAL
jgi:predicted peroxiredoxin